MKNLLSLTLFLLLFGTTVSAQGYRTITGKVVDQKTGKPLAYAHVGIPERGIGTTSGNDGGFTFKVPDQYLSSTLMVSFIGYQTYKKQLKNISGPLTVRLQQVPSDLVEVVVLSDHAIENIIRKAVARIPDNYPIHSTTNLGFYRESRTDDSLNYIYLAEGVLNIYKTSYKKKKEGQIGLVQGRKMNLKDPLDTTFHSGFTSGHMAAHRFDFVKNRIPFIDEQYFPVYKYWVEKMTVYNDRPVYIIGFDVDEGGQVTVEEETEDNDNSLLGKILNPFGSGKKKKVSVKGRMKGRIFIDQESYAFLRAEFEITEEGLQKYNDYPLYAGRWQDNKYVVNYRQLGDKWYFSDAIREGIYGSGGTYNNEIKITEINTKKSGPLPYQDRLQRGDAFTRMTGEYDEDFWKSYNTTPMSMELAESVRQLQTIRKAQEAFSQENLERIQQQRDSLQELERIRLEEIARQNPEEEEFVFAEPGIPQKKKKRDFPRVKFNIGTGAHLLATEVNQMGISYLTESPDDPEVILAHVDQIKPRDFEVIAHMDLDYFIHKNFFLRFGTTFDFYDSRYKERSFGLGTQLNLSKGRPFLFKLSASHSNFRYARKLGRADNDFGKFKVDGKKFNANKVDLYYGSRTHNLKVAAEFALELNRSQQLFVRCTYQLPFARRQDVWFWERQQLFKKKENIRADDSRLIITRNDRPFTGQIMPDESIMITVGLSFF